MASLHESSMTMGDDAVARLFSEALEAGDDWDDELLDRTIDEIVEGMLPRVAPAPPTQTAVREASTEEEEGEDLDDEDEAEEEPSADVVAEKRLRHRQAMQRCRERKRVRMDTLLKQQRRLKDLLRQRLHEYRLREQRAHLESDVGASTIDELRNMFAHTVRLKEDLLDERQALQDLILEHQKFEKVVTGATRLIVNEPTAPPPLGAPEPMEVDQNDSIDDSSSGQDSAGTSSADPSRRRHKAPAGHWVQYLDNEDPLFYEPEPEESVTEHTRETFLSVRRLQESFDNNRAGPHVNHTNCLGWSAHHTVVRTPENKLELRFRFRRRVPIQRMPLHEIQRATWNVMRDPVQNARLYSSLVVCKIVQFIGEDTFIFIRNAPDKDKRLHVRYFSMHSQTTYTTDKNERATVTLMKILDKDPHVIESSSKTPVVWLKQGTLYLSFTEKLEDKQIEIEYGGATGCSSDQHAQYLLIEVGGALMRWEHMVIPQRLLF